jgi:hypothetical protein
MYIYIYTLYVYIYMYMIWMILCVFDLDSQCTDLTRINCASPIWDTLHSSTDSIFPSVAQDWSTKLYSSKDGKLRSEKKTMSSLSCWWIGFPHFMMIIPNLIQSWSSRGFELFEHITIHLMWVEQNIWTLITHSSQWVETFEHITNQLFIHVYLFNPLPLIQLCDDNRSCNSRAAWLCLCRMPTLNTWHGPDGRLK